MSGIQIDVGNSEFKILPSDPSAEITGVHESLLQESEKDIIWYREHFFGKDHRNFLALDSPIGPVALSLIIDDKSYKAILRTNRGSQRISIQSSAVEASWWRKALSLGPSVKTIIQSTSTNIPISCLKYCKDPKLPNELLAMEERQVIRSYKFGVCYLGPGHSTEKEMFKNNTVDASPAFEEFLSFLGEKITLKSWRGYRGGLDTAENNTGINSVYTKWQGYEVMYHVSTLLPYNASDQQQLERKRHIGNDIALIVFTESDVPFQMSTITSKQNHVIAFVKPEGDKYLLKIAARTGVESFSPALPDPCIFRKDAVSRDFFLHKIVNGERASYKAPGFAPKIMRTRSVLLYDVAERYLKGA